MLTNVDFIFLYGIRQFLNALIHGSQLDFFLLFFWIKLMIHILVLFGKESKQGFLRTFRSGKSRKKELTGRFDQESVEKKNFLDDLIRKESKKGTLRTFWSRITNELIYLLSKSIQIIFKVLSSHSGPYKIMKHFSKWLKFFALFQQKNKRER